jgi:hypothetical protein
LAAKVSRYLYLCSRNTDGRQAMNIRFIATVSVIARDPVES